MDNKKLNVLFIMTDQLRADYLSIAGHPVVETPAIDRIGNEGTFFRNAYVQSAVCGPSRACFYTGRYVHTHNSRWNDVPLPIAEKTFGHYFEEAGYRAAVIGKTHMFADHPKFPFVKDMCTSVDKNNMSRVDSVGFEYVTGAVGTVAVPPYEYYKYLNSKGYPGWGKDLIRHCYDPQENKYNLDDPVYRHKIRLPCNVKKEEHETSYLTDRAIKFMEENNEPWALHLSFFSPHPTNIAPYPYNEMYDAALFEEALQSEDELQHPLFDYFRHERSDAFGNPDDPEFISHYRAVYAGMVRLIDDNLNRLFEFMDDEGIMDNTMIIFTSDHGEMMGDHYFFEKEMCYKQSYHIPMLVRCPGITGGVVSDMFVESVDVLPSCLDAAGLEIPPAIQGKSLLPLMRREVPNDWRHETYAEWTFEYYKSSRDMNIPREKCRAIMLRDKKYNYCHFNGLPDLLFDLEKDPDELHNVAQGPDYQEIKFHLLEKIVDWQLATWDPMPLKINTGWPMEEDRGADPDKMIYNFGA